MHRLLQNEVHIQSASRGSFNVNSLLLTLEKFIQDDKKHMLYT